VVFNRGNSVVPNRGNSANGICKPIRRGISGA
jgi:hypothetical protein